MRMKHLFLFAMLAAAVFGGSTVQAGVATGQNNYKVDVCHIPPGNPDNWHIINVSVNSVPAHMGHGDPDPFDQSGDPCATFRDLEVICDDYDACTVDVDDAADTCLDDHPPVDCDDSNPCTRESCDPTVGCQSAPIVCDDGDPCTVDMCNPASGACMAIPLDCGPLGQCLPETGMCNFPCEGVSCEPISQCHEAGQCVLSAEGLPVCMDGSAVAAGALCDDGDPDTMNDQCTFEGCLGECDPEVADCDDGDPDGGVF